MMEQKNSETIINETINSETINSETINSETINSETINNEIINSDNDSEITNSSAENSGEIVIKTEILAVGYGKRIVINDVNLEIRAGQIHTLIGPNGAGKSTILKTITRQLKKIDGVVYLSMRDAAEIGKHQGSGRNAAEIGKHQGSGGNSTGESCDLRDMSALRDSEVARSIAMVMTERIRPELMTCREVVSTGRYPYTGMLGILSKEDWEKVDEAMELVKASETASSDFGCISDGQRQRVMLARALCQEPKVLILDEPTSFLDMKYKLDILSSIRKMARENNIAVIMSLHELELARKISDVLITIDGTKVDRVGTPAEIISGNYIQNLYKIEESCFNPMTGVMELAGEKGDPEVFVIAGGGSGFDTYYELMRKGVSFAAGVIFENDIEFPTVKALASRVVSEKAFREVSAESIEEAKAMIDRCGKCIICLENFGPMNERMKELVEYAAKMRVTG